MKQPEEVIERRATETPAPQAAIERRATVPDVAPSPKADPAPPADKDRLMQFWKDQRKKYGTPSQVTT